MSASILVATPHAAFGELLRISLEESGAYQVRLVISGHEVRASASRGHYQLAILDSALSDVAFVPLCMDLLELQQNIRLVIIPPENNPNHSSLGGLIPHGYLSRPFYLPDLIDIISRLLEQSNVEQRDPKPLDVTLPPWLQDPQLLPGYLERQLLDTQALAGIVGVHGTEISTSSFLAHAGQLDDESAQELTRIVFRYWNRDEKTDLMRFVRLTPEKKDYLIYATQVIGGVVLILVYDSSAPLSQIRPQTRIVAQALATPSPEESELLNQIRSGDANIKSVTVDAINNKEIELPYSVGQNQPEQVASAITPAGRQDDQEPASIEESSGAGEPIPKTAQSTSTPQTGSINQAGAEGRDEQDQTLPDIWEHPLERDWASAYPLDGEDLSSSPMDESQEDENQALDDDHFFNRVQTTFAPYYADDLDFHDNGREEEAINLSELLGSVPSPDPDVKSHINSWEADTAPINPPLIPPEETDGWRHETEPEPEETSRMNGSEEELKAGHPPSQVPVEFRAGMEKPLFDLDLAVEEEIDSLEDTRPHIVAALTSLSQLESTSPALSQLNYTCILIPRLPQHYLTGELADRLAPWVQQLCLAFGWRLEGISVRPEYLQWTVQVSPSISPGNLIRIVRQRTSQQIFNQFAQFGEQNPSGDFWATGYLIVSGTQPPSPQLLRDYIAQTRKRQGLLR